MRYYEIAILSRPLQLTYQSDQPLSPGTIVKIQVRSKMERGVVIREVQKPDFKCSDVQDQEDRFFSKEQLDIAKFISTYYVTTLGETLGLFVPFRGSIPPVDCVPLCNVRLSKEQQNAYEALGKRSLLFGDTGSGKTEIYIKLISEQLRQKKRSILLMPEISLTPQMEERLRRYFGDAVVVWHSKLTKKRRREALEKIYSGEATIIAGPRSALFLPVSDLGLIVVDEEHDDSYKAQSNPHINARDVALYMGKELGIQVVLGSATPSVSTYHKVPTVRLRGSFYEGKKSFVYDSGSGLSPLILEEISKVLESKRQSLIFLPTRAHFKYIICQQCGEAVKCPYCDVGMSVHFDRRALVCHYCNYTEFIPKSCPNCGSEELKADRIGTKEVVEELSLHFPEARIAQFDRDTITTHTKLIKTLKAFSNKEIDILVGTQMLSKGHDYPDLALSIILDIDYILAMADYRARERAMSLFVQVAGRAGRKGEGRVIVQTKQREFFESFPDYEDFIRFELEQRKDLYPPFTRLAQLGFSHRSEERAREAMEQVLKCLKSKDVAIVGYGKNAIERIAGKYRYHILLRSPSTKRLLGAIYACKNELTDVDIDPINLA